LYNGFEWIDADNRDQSFFSFLRKGKTKDDFLVVLCNFTGISYPEFRIGVPESGEFREAFNSDHIEFGGTGTVNKKTILTSEEPYNGQPYSINVTIPAYGFQIIRPVKKRKERKGNGKEKVRSHAVSRRERK
jgi:1,4-alpha-glucan branching enzyme